MSLLAILERDFCRVVSSSPRPADPTVRTAEDLAADALVSIQNRQLILRQSAATVDGMRAELPEYEPDPPTPEEVIAAGEWKYGLAQEADQGLRPTPGREPRQL